MMYKNIIVLLILVSIFSVKGYGQRIELGKEVLGYLASDELQGRAPGTDGDIKARKFISQKFYDMWIERFSFGYEQLFTIPSDIKISEKTTVTIGDQSLRLDFDFRPFIFGSEGTAQAPLVFVGKSVEETTIDISGKVVLTYFELDDNKLPTYRDVINQVISARDKGALALIFAMQKDYGDGIEFFPFEFSRSVAHVGLPVIQISREYFHSLTASVGISISKVRKMNCEKINKMLNAPNVNLVIEYERISTQTANIAGLIEGNESNEWIVVGAHYDHLGLGGPGSGSREPDSRAVHNGADDNASGVALVIMLAEYYKKHKPKSNMAFVLFGGEEQGLLGSKHFVNHLPFPVEKIKAMINFDMVGRLKDSTLGISGVKSATEWEALLKSMHEKPLKLGMGGDGLSGSDQASFYNKDIPVLFLNTGLHEDYHTPNDDVKFINFDGIQLVANLSVRIIDSILNPKTTLTFSKSSNQQSGRNYKTSLKVKMGIMPDVAGVVQNGLGVDGVKSGGPAEKSGIKKGDVIIEIDGKTVTNIYDYMKRLGELEPERTIVVRIQRNGKTIPISVEL